MTGPGAWYARGPRGAEVTGASISGGNLVFARERDGAPIEPLSVPMPAGGGSVSLVDNGDGTATITEISGGSVVDNGDGTATITV